MKGAKCYFCSESFRNKQAVRAHLKGCQAYRQRLPEGKMPIKGTEPEAAALGNVSARRRPTPRQASGGGRARRIQPTETPELQDLDEPWDTPQRLDLEKPERDRRAQQQAEAAGHREQAREAARLRAEQEAEARARREAAEKEARDQRRRILQRVKDRVVTGYWKLGYTIPSDAEAEALREIEKELSKPPVAELPESELVTLAEGIRGRIYGPVLQAQDRAREEEERRQQHARRRASLLEDGVSYASRELEKEQDLDGRARFGIRETVKRNLEQELAGSESQGDVRALVDETLDYEIAEAEEERRTKARPSLITQGATYARRELAKEQDLDACERLRIERTLKEELEREITGDETEKDVEALVEDILDEELGETEEEDEDE